MQYYDKIVNPIEKKQRNDNNKANKKLLSESLLSKYMVLLLRFGSLFVLTRPKVY